MSTSSDSSHVTSSTVGRQRVSDDPAANQGSAATASTWDQEFLAILNNSAKTSQLVGAVRDRGFVVVTHGSASLQHVQALCHSPEQSFNTCLTARYRVSSPLVGNLCAAFVADLGRLVAGSHPDALKGDLLPLISGNNSSQWTNVHSAAVADLAARAELDRPAGELTREWIAELFRAFDAGGDPNSEPALGTGMRLVLFAEVEGPADDSELAELFSLPPLPERVGIVVSGLPAISIPEGMSWSGRATGRTGSVLELGIDPAKAARQAFSYLDVALTGDQLADTDRLNLRRYAQGLARLVMLPDTGAMTIGVHAPWGRGKSSFMRFIRWELVRIAAANKDPEAQQELADAEAALIGPAATAADRAAALHKRDQIFTAMEDNAVRDVIPVWFNAWRYDGATQIWAGLTHEITQRMERTLPRNRRIRARVAYSIDNQGSAFWFGAVVPTIGAIFLSTLVLLFGLGKVRDDISQELPDWAGWLAAIAPAVTTVAIGIYLAWRFSSVLTPVSERLLDYVRQPDYHEHMGYQHQVLRDIEFLYKRLGYKGKPPPRIVIFIDDLDRCSDEKVLETLQAINLLLTASGFYVFLGIDTHMIAQAIVREYELPKEDPSRAESYLRKIIQLSFRLPESRIDQRLAVLEDFFSDEARLGHLQLREEQADARRSNNEGLDRPGTTTADPPEERYAWDSSRVKSPLVAFEVSAVRDTPDELDAFARLRDLLPDNPREIKRLGNLHRLVKILVQRPEAPPTTADQRLLVAWLVFCFTRRDSAEYILRSGEVQGSAAVDLNWFIDLINRDQEEDNTAVLTDAELAPGTPLAEVAAISALFQEREPAAPA